MLTKTTHQDVERTAPQDFEEPLLRLSVISENKAQLAQWLLEKQSEELREKYDPILRRYDEEMAQLRKKLQRAY